MPDFFLMFDEVSKVTATATDMHSYSMLADQLTTDVQTGHQAVYAESSEMEETWLAKRQEVRDQRREISATLMHLATQVSECTEMLRSTILVDTTDDVTQQAFNIVQSGMGD